MRVLYFSRSYTGHDHRFLATLGASGHEIYYARLEREVIPLETRPVPPGIAEVAWAGGARTRFSPEALLRLMPSYEAVLRQVEPDLVHAGPVPTCGFMAALSCFRPQLTMSWGSDLLVDADRDEASRWIARYVLAASDMLAVDCAEVANEAKQLAGYPADRILQFPWGVDLGVFRPGSCVPPVGRPAGWEDGFVFVSTRSWEPHYGTLSLLEAFRSALAVSPQLRLLLLGDGCLRPQVTAFVEAHGLDAMVYMPGRVAEPAMANYFRAADVFVSCAFSDGSSVSLLEAMATELPVIVTDRQSNREWVNEGGGLLVPFGDTAAITAALVSMARMDGAQRRRMGERNRAVAVERADWRKNARVLLDGYERIATERKASMMAGVTVAGRK